MLLTSPQTISINIVVAMLGISAFSSIQIAIAAHTIVLKDGVSTNTT